MISFSGNLQDLPDSRLLRLLMRRDRSTCIARSLHVFKYHVLRVIRIFPTADVFAFHSMRRAESLECQEFYMQTFREISIHVRKISVHVLHVNLHVITCTCNLHVIPAKCRYRKTLQNEYLDVKIGVDTAENEPSEVLADKSEKSQASIF